MLRNNIYTINKDVMWNEIWNRFIFLSEVREVGWTQKHRKWVVLNQTFIVNYE